MRLRFSLYFFLLLAPLLSSSQYLPFPEDSALWVYKGYIIHDPSYIEYYNIIIQTEDSLIVDGQKIMKCRDNSNKIFYYMNDVPNRKVYRVIANPNAPPGNRIIKTLWYDFNIQQHDTIQIHYPGTTFFYVDSVITDSSSGQSHYYLYRLYNSTIQNFVIWREGIGSYTDLIEPGCCQFFENGQSLFCFEAKDHLSLHSSSGNCWQELSIKENNIPTDLPQVYPNPVHDFCNIHSVIPFHRIILYDSKGRKREDIILDSPVKEAELDFSHIQPGIYLLQLLGVDKKYFFKKILIQ